MSQSSSKSSPSSRPNPLPESVVVAIDEARKVRLLASEVPEGGAEARVEVPQREPTQPEGAPTRPAVQPTARPAAKPTAKATAKRAAAAQPVEEPVEGEETVEIRVRRLHRRDLKRTWEFLKLVFREVNRETVEYQRPRSRNRFFEVYEEEEGEQLLFEVGKQIVGYAECSFDPSASDNWINPRYFDKRGMRPLYVDELAVDPGYQGQGVGAFMLEQLQHIARLRGCTHLVLEVAENNKSALTWYRKRNFYKLDAAIFLAQRVDADPELLPPRKLAKKKAGAAKKGRAPAKSARTPKKG